MSTMTDLIDRELDSSAESDPAVIARRVLPRIPVDDRDALLAPLLAGAVRERIRLRRMRDRREAARASSDGRAGVSRWELMSERRVSVPAEDGEEWADVFDLGVAELRAIADGYGERARQMMRESEAYRSLADELEISGCATVGEMFAARGNSEAAA